MGAPFAARCAGFGHAAEALVGMHGNTAEDQCVRQDCARAVGVEGVAKDFIDLALQDVGALIAAHVGERKRVIPPEAILHARDMCWS